MKLIAEVISTTRFFNVFSIQKRDLTFKSHRRAHSGLLLPVEGFLIVLSVCLFVCPLLTNVHCEKTADSIEMPFMVVVPLGRVQEST